MRTLFLLLLFCFIHAPRSDAHEAISPDGFYSVLLEQPDSTQIHPKLILSELASGTKTVLFDYNRAGNPEGAVPFDVQWSPDSKHVAITIQSARIMKVEVFFITSGAATQIERLPIPTKFDTKPDAAPTGESVDHWEDSNTLWTLDNSKNRLFRYRFSKAGKLLVDSYEDHESD